MNFSRIFTKSHISTLSLASLMLLAGTSIHAMETGEEETPQDQELTVALEILANGRLHPDLIPCILQFLPHDETVHAFTLEALYLNPKFGPKNEKPRTTFEATLKSLSLGSQLFKAIKGLNAREVERLIANGASVNVQDKDGLTPAMLLIMLGEGVDPELLIAVTTKGVDFDIQNRDHKTIAEIAHAVRPGKEYDQLFSGCEKIKGLIKLGKSTERITKIKQACDGMLAIDGELNAITVLLMGGQFKLAETLLDWKWDVNTESGGLTPLVMAILCRHEVFITKLLKYGANANGNSQALRMALEHGSLEIVRLLVEAQFPINQEHVKLARQWAQASNKGELYAIAEYLENQLKK